MRSDRIASCSSGPPNQRACQCGVCAKMVCEFRPAACRDRPASTGRGSKRPNRKGLPDSTGSIHVRMRRYFRRLRSGQRDGRGPRAAPWPPARSRYRCGAAKSARVDALRPPSGEQALRKAVPIRPARCRGQPSDSLPWFLFILALSLAHIQSTHPALSLRLELTSANAVARTNNKIGNDRLWRTPSVPPTAA